MDCCTNADRLQLLCSGWLLRKSRLGTSATDVRSEPHIPHFEIEYSIHTLRIVVAVPGKFSPTRFTPAGLTLKKAGWPIPGQVKCEWANRIGPLLDVEQNDSPSFAKLREGLRRVVSGT
jgi:hypothetical protein